MTGLASCMLTAGFAHAHHGVNGQFDTSQTIEVSGVVTKVRFVNPHSYVYFDVTGDDGSVDEWRCELTSGSLLKRKGWTVDMFADGVEITIHGAPARKESTACFTQTITFAGGHTIGRQDSLDESGRAIRKSSEQEVPEADIASLDSQSPQLTGNWVSERQERRPRGKNGAPPSFSDGPDGRPERVDSVEARSAVGEKAVPPRPPAGNGGGATQLELTVLGRAAVEGFVREDNPRFHCQATNILVDWWFDQLVNRIEQTGDDIKLTYGFMDIARTIHLDLDEHPEGIVPSIAGHSIGKWKDGVLIVDTVGFAEGYLHVPPNEDGVARNSTELHIVERFTLSEDGTTLTRDYVADDSLYLVGTFSGQDAVKRTDVAYEAYNCEDLTGDTY
ncbi:DUF6152 family protein [Granulosicoccus antarcticus]|uniref:Uncharacterized protein n=1 Tax=Granulosicoccus antarcticus IMCC3135 TaxID=1192854 RepID=A0A2Z2NPP4_9GAMM|nr:DUF6152 family protein [Granulosicoccus antarcticus]ASJ73253.1 hypothetical protein IMCC3135_15855 [Granulosicoccus antarcticus IMCC3135]